MRLDAVCLVLLGGEVAHTGDPRIHRAAAVARTAAERQRRPGVKRAGAARRKPAIAAAAADRLGKNAGRADPCGIDVSGVCDRHIVGAAAVSGSAAKGERDSAIAAGGERSRKAAIAAAAANRLRHDPIGAVARGAERSDICDIDSAAVGALPARPAKGQADPGIPAARRRNRKAAIAAAAADRLGDDRIQLAAMGRDRAEARHVDSVGIASGTARATEAERNTAIAAAGPRNRKAAIAAGAADRLGKDAVGIVLPGGDRVAGGGRGIIVDRNRAADAAGAAALGKGQAHAGISAGGDGTGKTAIAAAAANRLRKNTG